MHLVGIRSQFKIFKCMLCAVCVCAFYSGFVPLFQRPGVGEGLPGLLEKQVGFGCCEAVFPALQGGPHNATIGALAFQLREVRSRVKFLTFDVKSKKYIIIHHSSSFSIVLW